MIRQRRCAPLLLAACAALIFCLLGLAAPVGAAATIFPERQTGPFRGAASAAKLDAALAALMEKARTQGTPEDMVMGRIHDLAAALRYPLSGSDALAVFLDSLPPVPLNTADQLKLAREVSLQLSRVVLNQEIENTRAQLRAIRDLRALEKAASGPALRASLLMDLENTCYAVGVYLQDFNKRCQDPRNTDPVKNERLRFLDEAAANALQERRKAFLNRLETDRQNQDFIGGVVAEKVSALRFPFLDAIRMGFFLERTFEATDDALARQAVLTQAAGVLERHVAVANLALAHIRAIAESRPDDAVKQRLLREAADLHQAVLNLLSDSLARCRGDDR